MYVELGPALKCRLLVSVGAGAGERVDLLVPRHERAHREHRPARPRAGLAFP